MLKGKTVVLGVTGSIAAYKIANLASSLVKLHADVHVIMTKNATNFINPITFETLTKNKCMTDTFDRNFMYNVAHVSIADKADVMLVAPASANIIAKMAHGIADDMLSTTYLAMKCPVIVSPAMNVNMFTNPVVQRNIKTLEEFGVTVIPPDNGYLACGYTGAGKMPSELVLLDYILRETAKEKDLAGKRVLVTAGPTRESIDPVRFITNHSTGKMGYAVARQAMFRGAEVTLVSGPVSIDPPPFVNVVNVSSAQDMFEAVKENYAGADIIIKTAAVADYTPESTADEKIKKSDGSLSIPIKRTADILKWLGENKRDGQVLCGFSMETENMLENSRAKLQKKNADLIAANSLRDEGSGFGTDTNHLVLIKRDGVTDLPLLSKSDAADKLLDELLTMCR
ncbi:bifunctional phosphopantothenoylcysteine decarboxylase/phosphopantothenate--cysteine ligase CoaBC [Ruminococcus difficilis]|uniref:Coenzyme A biosynthesis bifunctional protein CoaBC n=1 Tax=Ruminococcus difficilis TaxID=2763069 RepID=A0A934WS24_9FIRM|nr:bifunctional phosphopantothenoylcysteine decarboxylase/phosphopantothenate--cysteine ligase CoaBC [Ruminococcus difficilis]MBK6088884.1 bifunctional phosphopantothenoylcysteine decarboxylase/phosphopantothenate--cysteine ligase CoaBC [Ruminococcus difficilis]MBR0337907.1 bifunctional phosphopantothenoylcysteine decarboxylase/phosphopantothenate--cysteine ligase CoaBC [Ruminococcus sp.]